VTDELSNALDRLVPPREGSGDWDDVLDRSGVTLSTAQSAPPRRRRLLVAIAVTVAVTAITAPALALLLGWIDRRDVSFSEGSAAPNVVKKQFYDLAIRPGPRFAVGVRAARAREVGKYPVRGKLRALWVAPTREGGFCFLYEGLFGDCRGPDAHDRRFYTRFVFSQRSSRDREAGRRPARRVIAFQGYLTARNAQRIELVYRDGGRTTIPFVYVSSPIDAGFFAYSVPRDRQTRRRAPVQAVLLDATGDVIARSDVPTPPPFSPARISAPSPSVQTLPTRLPSPPKPPLQRGSGDGASVTVGANGVAIWRTTGVSAERARLLRGNVTYTCFRLTRVFGFATIRGRGIDGAFAPQAAVGYVRLGRPLDGCDIAGGGYGHRWPDRFESHSPVEIPLTPRGRRFFADRAAARDLALFVRSRRMQQIRKLDGAAFERELHRAYPRLGRIRYRLTERGVALTETSSTGKRFEVVVRGGRIIRENLKPYAVVF
jgi:hypothetical protein